MTNDCFCCIVLFWLKRITGNKESIKPRNTTDCCRCCKKCQDKFSSKQKCLTPFIASRVCCSHRCRNKLNFGGAKDFCSNFPKLSRKSCCATFFYKISPTKITETFLCCGRRKRSFFVSCKRWVSFSGILPKHLRIFTGISGDWPKFSGICSDFQKMKTFGAALAPPPLTPLVLVECDLQLFVLATHASIQTQKLNLFIKGQVGSCVIWIWCK